MNTLTTYLHNFAFNVYPYICLAVFFMGSLARFDRDQYTWKSDSSQMLRTGTLRWGSNLFHIGILAVLMGHVMGLLIPENWTDAAGLSEDAYHLMAVGIGAVAGVCTLFGVAMLIYRRRTTGPVFAATTKNDKTMYVFLVAAICLGLLTTIIGSGVLGDGYNYRETVSPWFRSIFLLNPQPELMAEALPSFQVHAVAGMLLFIIWPFTRLVHAFSAPVLYLFRPYVVYRERGPHDPGSREPRRGWEKVGS